MGDNMSRPLPSKEQLKIRFMSYVYKSTVNDCWLWFGAHYHNGYGAFSMGGKNNTKGAHVASYQLFKGETNSLNVLHTCDNPNCVNPDHLFLGTQAANALDAIKKSRWDGNGNVKLAKKDVLEIIRLRTNEHKTYFELSRIFNISESQIGVIVRKNRETTS